MGILQQLETLLGNPKMFSPTSAIGFFPALPAGQLPPVNPLLVLINDKNSPAPKFPLTIPAIKSLVESAGAGELHTLEGQILDAIKSPVDPANPLASLKKIFDGLNTLAENVATQVVTLITHQLVIGASLISIVNALKPQNLDAVFAAQSQYFFGHVDAATKKTVPGYVTIANETIAPPELPTPQAASASDLKTVKSYFSRKTGDQYVRDLTRVGFEAIANDTWRLESRYDQIAKNAANNASPEVKINDADKAHIWFKGFADFAEASVTSAVEQALQGGGPIDSNPLFAAGVATAAGTAARKAAQHVFLQEIGIK